MQTRQDYNYSTTSFTIKSLPETAYEIAMKTTMNYPWKYLWFSPRILKFHGCCTHEISAMPWNYHENVIWRFISWPMKQPMVYHELTFMEYFIGWIKFSWKHHRCFMAYLPGSENSYQLATALQQETCDTIILTIYITFSFFQSPRFQFLVECWDSLPLLFYINNWLLYLLIRCMSHIYNQTVHWVQCTYSYLHL